MDETQIESARHAHESACARVASQFPQRWLRGYVGSKLLRDPVFEAAYGLLSKSDKPILDVGCGVGLLAFYLRERGCNQRILGLDVDARKIRQGIRIERRVYDDIEFRCQDALKELPEFEGDVVLFDVLHYLAPSEQASLLQRLARCVAPGGTLLVRDCPREKGMRFRMTWAAEKFAQLISWNLRRPLHFPSRESITEAFGETEFDREIRPMWGSSPFHNYLFVFRRKTGTTTNGNPKSQAQNPR